MERTAFRASRRGLLGAAVPTVATVLAACGPAGGDGPGSAQGRPANAPPVELRLWLHWGGRVGELAQGVIDQYNTTRGAQDRIKTEIEVVSSVPDEYRAKMTAARLGGAAPDVYHHGLAVSELAHGQIIAELPAEEATYVKANYTPGALQRVVYRGKVWSHPTQNSAAAVVYRKSYLRELGLQPPTTAQQLRDLAKRLNRTEGDQATRLGFVFNFDNPVPFFFAETIARFGGKMVTFEGDKPVKINVSTPQAIEAVRWYVSMVEDGSTLVGRQLSVGNAWVNGVAAMGEAEPNLLLNTVRNGGRQDIFEDAGMVRLPPSAGVNPVAYVNGWALSASKDSKQSDARWRFIRWMMRKPEMPFSRFIVEQAGSIPAPTEYPTPIPGWTPDMIQGYVRDTTAVAQGHPLLQVLGKGEMDGLCATAIQGIVQKRQAPLEALRALEPQLNDVLKKWNP
jgi:ABC-type glycerol-3-phosphate transport system substrate-binding protein